MTLRFALDSPVRRPTIVFDVGGTWFRSAIAMPGGKIVDMRRRLAISYVSHPAASITWLRAEFVRYVTEEVAFRMRERSDISSRVSIALGAALDQRTGIVWNAGPLWGTHDDAFDLPRALEQAMPHIDWVIVNDVTATLLYIVRQNRAALSGTLLFVTVSSGIAARSWSTDLGGIPLDGLAGLQGEIGHLPVTCTFRDSIVHGCCACGGNDHLNAFCSGRGIEFLLSVLGGAYPDVASMLGKDTDASPARCFTQALERNCSVAWEILLSAVDPLARTLLTALAMDPHISRVLFGGGVLDGIGHSLWLGALDDRLRAHGAYQISSRFAAYFRSLLGTVDTRDAGLIGAAYSAWSRLPEGCA